MSPSWAIFSLISFKHEIVEYDHGRISRLRLLDHLYSASLTLAYPGQYLSSNLLVLQHSAHQDFYDEGLRLDDGIAMCLRRCSTRGTRVDSNGEAKLHSHSDR